MSPMLDPKHPMRGVFAYVWRRPWPFSLTCAASIANKILDLMPPILVGWVIDTVRGAAPPWIKAMVGTSEPWTLSAFLAALAVAIFAFESLFQWAYQYGFMNLAQAVQHDIRMDAYKHLQNRELRYFENQRTGEMMAILGDDINQLERFLNTGFNEILQLGVLFVFAGGVMLGVSGQLALIGIVPIPIILWGSLRYQRVIGPRYARVRRAVGAFGSRLENNIAGIQVIKSFTAERFEYERVRRASREYQRANSHAIALSSMYVPMIRMAVAVGFGGVLLIGSHQVLQGRGGLTVGELVLFSMMIQRLLWPLTRLGVTIDDFERAAQSARRVLKTLATPCAITDPKKPVPFDRARGDIGFDAVQFAYDPELPVLQSLDFRVPHGKTVGIAGATGCGKSTLIKLLLRYYDVDGGGITIDGQDIRKVRQEDLRRNISLVSQDVYLFDGTIAENIAYGTPGATATQIEESARLAQLHDFVSTLGDGYNSVVGERGIKLSGGQRQRLSIARAILKNAPIMVFDEATSSVDTETERAIQANIMRLTRGRTALVIAHRLSTIRHADEIVVLQAGSVVERGHHEDLLNDDGVYADLWHIQLGESSASDRWPTDD